jgi:hypothetical protein
MRIVLYGDLPAKKNRIKAVRGRGGHYDKETAATIENLILQARAAWGSHAPVRDPALRIKMWIANNRKDRDGILTTLLDVLVQARVLHDDAVLLCNGIITLLPATLCKKQDERAEIDITW